MLESLVIHVHELCERTRVTRSSVTVHLFAPEDIAPLKLGVTDSLRDGRHTVSRSAQHRTDIPIDVRFPELLLKAAEDPDLSLGTFASGVRVGPGARLLRLLARHAPQRRWTLSRQSDPLDHAEARPQEGATGEETVRLRQARLTDQASRGQVLVHSEQQAKRALPKPDDPSPGRDQERRVLFDGTNGIAVNKSARRRVPSALSHSRQTSPKHVVRFPSQSAVGTPLIAKTTLVTRCASTPSGLSASPRPLTTGRGSLQQLDACPNISLEIELKPGTGLSLTTITSSREGSMSVSSLHFLRPLRLCWSHNHGTRQQGGHHFVG